MNPCLWNSQTLNKVLLTSLVPNVIQTRIKVCKIWKPFAYALKESVTFTAPIFTKLIDAYKIPWRFTALNFIQACQHIRKACIAIHLHLQIKNYFHLVDFHENPLRWWIFYVQILWLISRQSGESVVADINTFTAIVDLSRFNNSYLKYRQRRP